MGLSQWQDDHLDLAGRLAEQTESTRMLFLPMLDWIRLNRVFASCFVGKGGSTWISKIRTKT
ncbi:MAG: hypothetical protein KDA62_05285, partial [Planctomycetales bacterium]|nr:hypothetical protein [Planctomycetales bacterium]